ncbi:putative E3 ubiquitin-protein ligase RF298 [Cynara cardunculus var. scolymus]|uniref:putative E3 ubiquitin-protein ligase RF298 n=1 Tax=Cynara cardunculus var. scolymus TaxID=59895 RepID=UPI000D625D03|nr:putative E3 ubiquitin-protein ligase RF298 [Cynara cardunculus var. scolymus]XP_024986938.1 putative E3 ubiquitin-protein ligase RF298 [Cynara cardunculus var. scolymus]XP_024986939.1 putative E3 ubiquitin-protein ligase RF298 [Cynara cardunculus var. scolymus]XP_024986940.1 putative E3 ubiquitin-protein ligase RF298 [Cynara cardunculus var. scolymus]
MASIVAKSCTSSSSHVSPVMTVQEKGSRNKRKFRADPPPPNGFQKIVSPSQNECLSYEFSAENFESPGHSNGCDMCSFSHENTDSVKLDLGLSCAVGGVGSTEVGANHNRVELEASDEFHEADWSDLTESQLEELVLANLDTMFKSAIKKIVSFGYTEEVATKAILRAGLCCGCKDNVSNIAENTLILLKNGQEMDPSGEHHFENLHQMKKYILAELVCVLREFRPFFSTGDAMWCLLISDMNVSQACAMDGEALSSLVGDGTSNGCFSNSVENQLRKDGKSLECLPNPCKPNHSSLCAHSFPLEAPVMASIPCVHNCMSEEPAKAEVPHSKPKAPFVLDGFASQKGNQNSTSRTLSRSFSLSSKKHEEKVVGSRKITCISKRDYIPRQKSVHLEKSNRIHGLKGATRAGKLGNISGLILDKKLKSVSDSTGDSPKNGSQISQGVGIGFPFEGINNNGTTQTSLASPSLFNTDTSSNNISSLAKIHVPPMLASTDSPPALSVANTELSLSLPAKSNNVPMPEVPNISFAAMPYDKSFGRWIPQDKRDKTVLKLVPRVQELQNQLQEWTEWANQKVMQAARRLGKDKAELKTLRQEKEEVDRLKKEKQTLEENTMKKLSEMENALFKASGQVERANSAVCRLEVENANLRLEMEAANLQAAESATSCEEVSKREKKTLLQLQLWEKQKILFQEELITEKRKLVQLQEDLELAKEQRDQLETRWKQEEKAKEDLVSQAVLFRIGRQEGEVLAKSREDLTRLKADKNLKRYKDDIEKLKKEISLLRLKADSSKIAALRRGIDGSYASKLSDIKTSIFPQETPTPYILETVTSNGGVKRERECVMCLSEEMAVVFLPCAHQVVCTKCNELHEKQGMKDCPSCRGTIQRRISVRYAHS